MISRILFIREYYSVMFSLTVLLVLHGSQYSSVGPPGGQAAVWEPWKYRASLVFQDSGKSTSPLFSSHWSSPSLRRSSSDAFGRCCAPDSISSSSLTSGTLIPTARAASCLSFGRGSINSATCSSGFNSKSQWDRSSGRYLGKKNWFPVKLNDHLLFHEHVTVRDCNMLHHILFRHRNGQSGQRRMVPKASNRWYSAI